MRFPYSAHHRESRHFSAVFPFFWKCGALAAGQIFDAACTISAITQAMASAHDHERSAALSAKSHLPCIV
jgi:hypothetical protein